jgi:hypothetical protein
MEYGTLIHEMIPEHLMRRLSRDYKEIKINRTGEKKLSTKAFILT